jgi:hypothetical protein
MAARVRLFDADYAVADLPDGARALLGPLGFVEQRLSELRGLEAVLLKARTAYVADLKREFAGEMTDYSVLISS